jgi:hypothetical protein
LSQFRLAQSVSSSHGWPVPQFGSHVGGRQTLLLQVFDAQSPFPEHESPVSHVGLQSGGAHV